MLAKTMKSLCLAAMVLPATPVLAGGKCTDMKVRIVNYEREKMRILKIRAYNREDDKWRTIRTSNFEAHPASPHHPVSTTVEDNVPKSDGEDIAIRVQYRFHFGSNTTKYRTDSAYASCATGRVYSVTIPNSGHVRY